MARPLTDQELNAYRSQQGASDWKTGAYDSLFRDFGNIFHRNPTADEVASLLAAYDSGDPHRPNTAAGASAVAQYYQSVENTPDKQYARQQAEYQQKAPEHYGTIDQMFQSTLGRAATDAEKSHFGALMASGQVDPYTIGQFLQALPESVRKQDEEFRKSLASDLQKQDVQYYNEQIMPGVQSAFANQGRDVRSTGFSNALALAAQQQNRQRESFLSNLTANQYAGSQGLAQRDYLNTYGAYQGLQDYSRQRASQMQDATTGRVNELQNYALQRRAYDDYLARYGKRTSWMDYANLGINAINAGANVVEAFKPSPAPGGIG